MASVKNVINFRNDYEGEYYCFSSFYNFEFTHTFSSSVGEIYQQKFDNVEQGFQYLKFFKPGENKISSESIKKMISMIVKEKSGSRVKKMCSEGYSVPGRISEAKIVSCRSDWNLPAGENSVRLKYAFLFDLLKSRFEQDKQSLKILLSTGDSILRECSTDEYMGVGKDDRGENLYGRILMAIRDLNK